MHVFYSLIQQFHKKKKFVANKCTYQSPWYSVYLSLKRRGLRGVCSLREANWNAQHLSLHSLFEQPVWRCNYYLKINPKSNSVSKAQIQKILWWDLNDLQTCNRERGFKSRSQELWKSWENMAFRKLNVLLYAFTGKAETLRNGSSGICK